MKRIVSFVVGMVFVLVGVVVVSPIEAAKLRIGAHRELTGSFEVVAHRKGYWKEEGLSYSIKYFKEGRSMRNAIIQNNLDVGTTGFSPFVTGVSKGAKVVAIGVTANICGTQYIVVPMKSKAKSVKDLKGTVFAARSGTSVGFAFKSYVLPRHGLKAQDLHWLNVDSVDRISAIKMGVVQGAIVGDPQMEIARNKGLIRVLEDFCIYDKTRMMHVGNPKTLKAHPELYEKYFRGWLKAHKLLKENTEEYAKTYHEALTEVGDKAEYSVSLAVVKRLRSEPFITDEVRAYLNDMAEKQKKLGWIRHNPGFTKSKWLDDSILRKAAGKAGMKS